MQIGEITVALMLKWGKPVLPLTCLRFAHASAGFHALEAWGIRFQEYKTTAKKSPQNTGEIDGQYHF